MTRAAGRSLLLWLLAMLAGALIVWHSRFSADMSFFLPAHPTPAQRVIVDQLKEGAVTRLLMLSISGGDSQQRAALSRTLHDKLASAPEFSSLQNGENASLDAERDRLLAHRYLLSPAVTPERFSVAGLNAAITNSIDLLTSPAGLMLKPFLTRDPTGELLELLNNSAEMATANGNETADLVKAIADNNKAENESLCTDKCKVLIAMERAEMFRTYCVNPTYTGHKFSGKKNDKTGKYPSTDWTKFLK